MKIYVERTKAKAASEIRQHFIVFRGGRVWEWRQVAAMLQRLF